MIHTENFNNCCAGDFATGTAVFYVLKLPFFCVNMIRAMDMDNVKIYFAEQKKKGGQDRYTGVAGRQI